MSASTSEDQFVHLGPIRVRVRVTGDGPPLLMIMGIGGNLDMWEPLTALLPDRQLVTFDFPGTGDSTLSWLPPTMPANALLVRALIRKLGYDKVDVLGYSWGGVLAQHVALQHRSVVSRLILASTTVGWGGRFPRLSVAGKMVTPLRYYSRSYFKRIAPSLYGGRYRLDPAYLEAEVQRRLGRPPSLPGYGAQLTAIMSYSSLPILPLISARTLVLAGDDDPIVPTFNPKLIAAAIRHATLRILPGAGHLLLFDSPEVVAPLIDEFLGQ